jgi:CYTH domain-containing protein
MVSRVPGRGRYAFLEREQRWLLACLPDDVSDPRTIDDRYIDGTQLRLRRVQSPKETVLKLAQKVRHDPMSPERVQLTNMYLSENEYALLATLPAAEVHKTRWTVVLGNLRVAVDEFHGLLAGLVLMELELAEEDSLRRLPSGALADVTDDDRFSGGSLARADATTASELLAQARRPR